jgi:hypothetical protein
MSGGQDCIQRVPTASDALGSPELFMEEMDRKLFFKNFKSKKHLKNGQMNAIELENEATLVKGKRVSIEEK